ncbi:MAG: hypothetical protein K0Q79_298 [Flavipsychrobacter sp.]|nr:hypothetical protein [Flavipsychrobacter sp.]
MQAYTSNSTGIPKYLNNPWLLFSCFWLVTFVLYFPAAKAGMDGDFPYWVLTIKSDTFFEFINTRGSALPILYQFSQLAKYIFYQMFGLNPWLWHLLHITLNAIAALLLFKLFRKILDDSRIAHSYIISFSGVLLFCIMPHANEVIVREMCYHYVQGFIFILLILWWLLRFVDTQNVKYAWMAGLVYLVSTFSLEIFYLTPWLVLTVMAYYRLALNYDKGVFKRSLLLFFVPQIIMFLSHLLLLRMLWGNRLAHIGTLSLDNPVGLLNKPILYFFHVLFLGRYFPQEMKLKVYAFFESGTAVAMVYGIAALLFLIFIVLFRRIHIKIKAVVLFGMISAAFVLLATPLDFAPILRVIGDRYIYIPSAFTAIIFVLLVSFIRYKVIAAAVFLAYFIPNLICAVKTNKSHYNAASIAESLLTNVPEAGNKKILLLNLPACIKGALIIRAQTESEFKIMNNLFYENKKITNKVYDVCAYNMLTPDNGAHVTVYNDSMMHVTLNQWGTWWWYGDLGAYSYENEEYRLNMMDLGHWYELTLKHPASEYLILYQVGSNWKTVDWNIKNIDQN